MKLALDVETIIAIATARFSLVCPQVALTHPRMIELTAYVPIANITMLTYRAATLLTANPKTNPIIATHFAMVMCHVRSLRRPEDQDQ